MSWMGAGLLTDIHISQNFEKDHHYSVFVKHISADWLESGQYDRIVCVFFIESIRIACDQIGLESDAFIFFKKAGGIISCAADREADDKALSCQYGSGSVDRYFVGAYHDQFPEILERILEILCGKGRI